jgi:hypothetical protein
MEQLRGRLKGIRQIMYQVGPSCGLEEEVQM